jgi:hypothetical protein
VFYGIITGLAWGLANLLNLNIILIIRKNIRVPDIISVEITKKTRYNNIKNQSQHNRIYIKIPNHDLLIGDKITFIRRREPI